MPDLGRFWREYCPHFFLFDGRRIPPYRLSAAIKNRSKSYRIWFIWGRLMILTESKEVVPQETVLKVREDLADR